LRIITVEEHFHHPEVVARVQELAGPPPVTPDAGFGAFLQDFIPDKDSAERLAGPRLAHLDQVGIDIQVVSHSANSPSSLDHSEAVDLCRKVNDALAEQISQHPTRFRGFATIPLHDPAAAAEEMRRCVNELGFVGTPVMGTCGRLFLDDERFDPVLTAAEGVDLPIYVHPGTPGVDGLQRGKLASSAAIPVLQSRLRLARRGWHPAALTPSALSAVSGTASATSPEFAAAREWLVSTAGSPASESIAGQGMAPPEGPPLQFHIGMIRRYSCDSIRMADRCTLISSPPSRVIRRFHRRNL